MKNLTIGIFAHANAGKTTVTEQLLYNTNTTKKIGRVDYGNTTTDNMEIEKRRGISVRASVVTFSLNDRNIQLIDTPGHVDFSAEVERAINVLDGAILVVSGVEGVEPQTHVIWKQLMNKKVPTFIFINKLDRQGADFNRVVKEIKEKLNVNAFPIIDIDAETLVSREINYKEHVEDIIVYDEELFDRYVAGKEINDDELKELIIKKGKDASLYPLIGGSALKGNGINLIMDSIDKYFPEYKKENDDFSAYVYSIRKESETNDVYVKVINGTLVSRMNIGQEKVTGVYKIVGGKKTRCDILESGELGIITGINAKTGQVIGLPLKDFKYQSFVKPMIVATVNVKKEDIQKALDSFMILNIEDSTLNVTFNNETKEITLSLMGELQADVLKTIVKERFDLDIEFSNPTIIHKETVSKVARAKAGYTRVSNVELELRPLPRGSGIKITSEYSTDYLFPKYQNQIKKLIQLYSNQGIYGWKIDDMEICIVGGKCDSVGSDPSHFNIATPIALYRALKNADVKLLESMCDYDIQIPIDSFSNVYKLLWKYQIQDDMVNKTSSIANIKGRTTYKNIIQIEKELKTLTSGMGSIVFYPSGYELSTEEEIITRPHYMITPIKEHTFLQYMKASKENLDKGLVIKADNYEI